MRKLIIIASTLAFSQAALSMEPSYSPDEFDASFGYFKSTQGKFQHINKTGLLGDDYSITSNHPESVFVGFGALWHVKNLKSGVLFGGAELNYYNAVPTKGNIAIEGAFTNLAYQYDVSNTALIFKLQHRKMLTNLPFSLNVELGVGPNIMSSTSYLESSLDNGITTPANTFSSKTVITYAATAGVSLMSKEDGQHYKYSLGYRFNLLGQGKLSPNVANVETSLFTGNVYNHALVLSIHS